METSPSRTINIEALSFTSGAHLLLKQTLKDDMRAARKARLEKLGFSGAEAADLSALHTRNFM